MDIDKAYIMGLSYNTDKTFMDWSPLFNYKNSKTFEASLHLPIPSNLNLMYISDIKFSIEKELDAVINSSDEKRIENIIELIYKLEKQNGFYYYDLASGNHKAKAIIIKQIQEHEKYKFNKYAAGSIYKNIAACNIRNVINNIRNRDLAYIPVAMDDIDRLASESPKGKDVLLLNMINPFTKYIMLYQALIGKGVVGIVANGEKDFFNITYYYHELLRNNYKLDHLLIHKEYNRIKDRYVSSPVPEVVKIIPDLWNADELLKIKLKELFYALSSDIDMNDKEVDQTISQLLNAATDNAKHLYLAKINAGTNMARYYLHLVMLGFSLNDIVAFMTSPAIELIDKYSTTNLYNNKEVNTISSAIKLLKGDIDVLSMIIKPNTRYTIEQEQAEMLAELAEAELELVLASYNIVIDTNSYEFVTKLLKDGNVYKLSLSRSLNHFIKKYIQAKLSMPSEEDTEITKMLRKYILPTDTDNINVNYVFKQVNNIINSVSSEINKYNENHPNRTKPYTLDDFNKDILEFEKVNTDASETSKLASVWLKLNQGIPTTDVDIVLFVNKMRTSISTRESYFGIKIPVDSINHKLGLIDDGEKDDTTEYTDKDFTKNNLIAAFGKISVYNRDLPNPYTDKVTKAAYDVIDKIMKNNKALSDWIKVRNILVDALEIGLYGNFDPIKFAQNVDVIIDNNNVSYHNKSGNVVKYREIAAAYYNLIKSTWNILDIVNTVPHYKVNLDLLGYSLTNRNIFSIKAKVVDKLVNISQFKYELLTPRDYKKISQFADIIITTSFFLSLNNPISLQKINKWLHKKKGVGQLFKQTHVYNDDHKLVPADELEVNSISGMNSLKYFVETYFLKWLQEHETLQNNEIVKALRESTDFGRTIIRIESSLAEQDMNLGNKVQYQRYLKAMEELMDVDFDENYKVGDILGLYTLGLNGTRLGKKNMTALFKGSVKKGVLYEYFKFIGNNDYNKKPKFIMPSRKDLLIFMAPTVNNIHKLKARTEPFVKVFNAGSGYDIYRKIYDLQTRTYRYDTNNPVKVLEIYNPDISLEEKNKIIYNFIKNSFAPLSSVHEKIRTKSVFDDNNIDLNKLAHTLIYNIKLSKIFIQEIC